MDYGEFSDVSLDTCGSSNFKSCENSQSLSSDPGESDECWRSNVLNDAPVSPKGSLHNHTTTTDSSKPSVHHATPLEQTTQSKDLTELHSSVDNKATVTGHYYEGLAERPVCTDTDTISGGSFDSEFDQESIISQANTETAGSIEDVGDESESAQYTLTRHNLKKRSSRNSIDELLFDLYDKHGGSRLSIYSFDGSSTDCSSLSEYQLHKSDNEQERTKHSSASLQQLSTQEMNGLLSDLNNKVCQKNAQLVKCLRNRERHRTKISKHCDMITAVLQAWSNKSSSDAKMKFTMEPVAGEANFEQWRDAMTALVRRPVGLPSQFRSKVWLSLASKYIEGLQIDWSKVVQFAFNDKCNPDDDALGAQIVKDLHRTGCSSFSGVANEDDRVILQRVLLGYARWNKVTGYCQGFNILAAFILNVTNKNEVDALKVMVYLVDAMLPKEYFAHNLRALTVDMAVFRNYLSMKLPRLSAHLVKLQHDARDTSTGVNVEPPLTNVFTMQWFLTMFATCLPMATVHKIWDCVMIDGSEILIRTALALWTKLAKKVIRTKDADEFYMTMGVLTQELMQGKIISADELVHSIYNMAPIPLPKLAELREKYMYDITPFSAAINSASHKAAYGEEESSDYIHELAKKDGSVSKTYHSLDVALLKRQYAKLTQRQRQARLLMKAPVTEQEPQIIPNNTTPVAINHLFVGKQLSARRVGGRITSLSGDVRRSRSIDDSVQPLTPCLSDELATRLNLYATTQQGNRQTLKYNTRKTSPTVRPAYGEAASVRPAYGEAASVRPAYGEAASEAASKTISADEKSEIAINEMPERKSVVCVPSVSSDDDSNSLDGDENTLGRNKPPACSEPGNDSVFLHRLSEQRSSAGAYCHVKDAVIRQQVRNNSPLRPGRGGGSNHSLSPSKGFNPFPKPSIGLLSAEKAKIGIKLGLYKPQDALAYMNPSERRQFLKDEKNFIGRMAMTSRSSLW